MWDVPRRRAIYRAVHRGGPLNTGTDWLDELARALEQVGLASRPHYNQLPAMLHVFDPRQPRASENVLAVPDILPGLRLWWFLDSSGQVIGPCTDIPGAVENIAERLTPYARPAAGLAAEETPSPPRRGSRLWTRLLTTLTIRPMRRMRLMRRSNRQRF